MFATAKYFPGQRIPVDFAHGNSLSDFYVQDTANNIIFRERADEMTEVYTTQDSRVTDYWRIPLPKKNQACVAIFTTEGQKEMAVRGRILDDPTTNAITVLCVDTGKM